MERFRLEMSMKKGNEHHREMRSMRGVPPNYPCPHVLICLFVKRNGTEVLSGGQGKAAEISQNIPIILDLWGLANYG